MQHICRPRLSTALQSLQSPRCGIFAHDGVRNFGVSYCPLHKLSIGCAAGAQGKTSQLEALLAAKEAELAALRDQLSQSANASSSGMHSSGDLQVRDITSCA